MKLILHIGAHKTGTTSIQSFLMNKQKKLKSKGWEFVSIRGVWNLGNCISFSRLGKGVVFGFYPQLYDELLSSLRSPGCNKIVSSEDLFFFNDDGVVEGFCKDLKSIFDEIVVVVYLRNQVDMAASNKAQGAKTSQSAMIFGNDYKKILPDMSPEVIEYLDFHSKIEMWRKSLPDAKFVIRKYDRNEMFKNDSVADFVKATELPVRAGRISSNDSSGSILTNILHGFRNNGLDPENAWNLFRMGYFDDIGGVKQKVALDQALCFMDEFSDVNRKIYADYRIDLSIDKSKYPDEPVVQSLDIDVVFSESAKVINRLMALNNSRDVDLIRDCALFLENRDLDKAYHLMKLAHRLRPEGPLIRRKLEEYQKRLEG